MLRLWTINDLLVFERRETLRRWTINNLLGWSTKAGLLLLRILHRRGNQTYVVLAKGSKVMYGFLCFWTVHVNRQKQRGPFKALDLKTDFSWFLRTKLDLWVDFSLIFTLVISQLIQENFQRKTSDLFFLLFYSKIFWLFYYYFSRYFDYFIIILHFFCLTMVTAWTIG